MTDPFAWSRPRFWPGHCFPAWVALLLCLLAAAPALAQESRTYELEGVIFTVPAPPEGWRGGKQGHGLVRYQAADSRASVDIYRHESIRVVGQVEESAPEDRAREARTWFASPSARV